MNFFAGHHIDYIINCAAFTAVDQAESQQEAAFNVNAGIPLILAGIAVFYKIRLLHISTDYVYDGTLSLPHTENETPAPASVYAHSKLEGEKAFMGSSVGNNYPHIHGYTESSEKTS